MMTDKDTDSTKTVSSPDTTRPESVTLKKGTLWQQRDKFFSRWKERFFILTSDYLACFKKASKIGISEMGGFLYKVNLADVDDLQWIDKKQDGVIAVRVGTEDQLLLWSSKGLDNWMFALRDAVNLSKGRREALRRSQTLMPQSSDGGLMGRHRVNHSSPGIVHSGSNLELCSSNAGPFMRSLLDKPFMPSINEYARRMSVLTEGDTNGDADDNASSCDYYPVTRHTLGPRLGPQCSAGSHSSLVSLGRRSENGQIYKPSPRSLQVSPALTQRSLYAQHILSSPEIHHQRATKSTSTTSSSSSAATSEFSFVSPDSPVAISSLRLKSRGSKHPPLQQQNSADGGFRSQKSSGDSGYRSQSNSLKQPSEKASRSQDSGFRSKTNSLKQQDSGFMSQQSSDSGFRSQTNSLKQPSEKGLRSQQSSDSGYRSQQSSDSGFRPPEGLKQDNGFRPQLGCFRPSSVVVYGVGRPLNGAESSVTRPPDVVPFETQSMPKQRTAKFGYERSKSTETNHKSVIM